MLENLNLYFQVDLLLKIQFNLQWYHLIFPETPISELIKIENLSLTFWPANS